mmetsp:Transcript_62781/g.130522  ORF Transcript_62781/g.130522 Transcript_62781/m.130522 type:complete len:385 (+) Transcript_62781:2217-3371(+)
MGSPAVGTFWLPLASVVGVEVSKPSCRSFLIFLRVLLRRSQVAVVLLSLGLDEIQGKSSVRSIHLQRHDPVSPLGLHRIVSSARVGENRVVDISANQKLILRMSKCCEAFLEMLNFLHILFDLTVENYGILEIRNEISGGSEITRAIFFINFDPGVSCKLRLGLVDILHIRWKMILERIEDGNPCGTLVLFLAVSISPSACCSTICSVTLEYPLDIFHKKPVLEVSNKDPELLFISIPRRRPVGVLEFLSRITAGVSLVGRKSSRRRRRRRRRRRLDSWVQSYLSVRLLRSTNKSFDDVRGRASKPGMAGVSRRGRMAALRFTRVILVMQLVVGTIADEPLHFSERFVKICSVLLHVGSGGSSLLHAGSCRSDNFQVVRNFNFC